jgi:hypothetical protein
MCLVTCETGAMCLKPKMVSVDTSIMTITTDHIYTKTCNMCDRPALTFDRDNRAFCPRHATIFLVIDRPVEDKIPVTSRLSG